MSSKLYMLLKYFMWKSTIKSSRHKCIRQSSKFASISSKFQRTKHLSSKVKTSFTMSNLPLSCAVHGGALSPGAGGGLLRQLRHLRPPGWGPNLAQDGEQEGVEALPLRPPHLRPLLCSQGGAQGLAVLQQGPGLPLHFWCQPGRSNKKDVTSFLFLFYKDFTTKGCKMVGWETVNIL